MTATWRPLGYNIRPRRLHAIARESVARYGGELPSDEETLRSFKGIGAYTAGAVLSFAFGQRAAILDTNVARVLFRVFVGRGDPKAHAMRAASLDAVADAAAGAPRLRLQPGADGLRRHGLHRPQAEVPALPDARRLRRLSLQPRQRAWLSGHVVVAAAVVAARRRAILVTRRLRGTHLEGFWEFPGGKCEPGETHAACLGARFAKSSAAALTIGEKLLTVAHDYADRTRRTALLPLRSHRRAAAAARSGDPLGAPRGAAQARVSRRPTRNSSGCWRMNGMVTTVTDLMASSPCLTSSTCPGSLKSR